MHLYSWCDLNIGHGNILVWTCWLPLLRSKYWIVSFRPLAKKVVRFCIACQQHDTRLLDQCMGPLPAAHITHLPPFSKIGFDYAGLMYCSDIPGIKLYKFDILCSHSDVYLELMDSLATDYFFLHSKDLLHSKICPPHYTLITLRHLKGLKIYWINIWYMICSSGRANLQWHHGEETFMNSWCAQLILASVRKLGKDLFQKRNLRQFR